VREQELKVLCEKRMSLINELENGNLTKECFIQENYSIIKNIKDVDFEVSSCNEGIVKYHYFNTLAKMKMMEADEIEFRDNYRSNTLKEEAYQYYIKKDKITLELLKLVDFKDVNAYYISLNSKSLFGSIYEIEFKELEKVVLHSRDRKIKYKLTQYGCFNDGVKESIVNEYVNTKVY